MAAGTKMVHVRMPEELIVELDRWLSEHPNATRSRTQFIVDSVVERLRREQVLRDWQDAQGAVSDDENPAWAGLDAAEWVSQVRQKEPHTTKPWDT